MGPPLYRIACSLALLLPSFKCPVKVRCAAAEVAETENLPVQAHRAHEGSARDVVVADVVHLEAVGAGIAQ